MKSSTKDQAEGQFHEAKGKVMEIIVKLMGKPRLEAEGEDEKIAGKIQERIGKMKNVVARWESGA
jgi:uncharacterized protein YjbJ (UPF0337 family)